MNYFELVSPFGSQNLFTLLLLFWTFRPHFVLLKIALASLHFFRGRWSLSVINPLQNVSSQSRFFTDLPASTFLLPFFLFPLPLVLLLPLTLPNSLLNFLPFQDKFLLDSKQKLLPLETVVTNSPPGLLLNREMFSPVFIRSKLGITLGMVFGHNIL